MKRNLGAMVLATGLMLSTQAGAAVINHVITINAAGAPTPFILDLTIDTDLLVRNTTDQTVGLTVNSFNFASDGTIRYQTPFAGGLLIFDDTAGTGVDFAANDFSINLGGFDGTTPSVQSVLLSPAGQNPFSTVSGFVTSTLVPPPAVVPLPAGASLLVAGVALMGVLGWRRRARAGGRAAG